MPPPWPWGGGKIISKIYRTKDVISTETHPWGKKLCFRTGRTNPRGIGFPPLGGGIPRGGEFWGDVGYKILIHHIITRNQEIHTSQVLNSTCPLHSISTYQKQKWRCLHLLLTSKIITFQYDKLWSDLIPPPAPTLYYKVSYKTNDSVKKSWVKT